MGMRFRPGRDWSAKGGPHKLKALRALSRLGSLSPLWSWNLYEIPPSPEGRRIASRTYFEDDT